MKTSAILILCSLLAAAVVGKMGFQAYKAFTYDPSEKVAREAKVMAEFEECVADRYEQTDKQTVEDLKTQGRAWQNLEHNSKLVASEICGQEYGIKVTGEYRY